MMNIHVATLTPNMCYHWEVVTSFVYWYQGVLRTQRRVNPASVRILMEAASASLTVSFTDCIRFWALWTNISVAWLRRKEAVSWWIIIWPLWVSCFYWIGKLREEMSLSVSVWRVTGQKGVTFTLILIFYKLWFCTLLFWKAIVSGNSS